MLKNLSGETALFPIIGDPIAFVKSPHALTAGFDARGKNAVCIPMHVAADDFPVVMEALTRTPNVEGLLITMPHKETAFAFCAGSDKTSAMLGGVSVMRRARDGTWHGGMLDGRAFVNAQVARGAKPKGARVLLIGAGAAGSAIAIALLEADVAELVIHDTDPSRVARLIKAIDRVAKGRAHSGTPDPAGFDMICNATPMGLSEGDALPFDVDFLKPDMFVGDVIAGHGTTPLVQAARKAGCGTADGTDMVQAVQDMMLDFMLA
jgi:shikimate dehydrogenase